jgi:phosphatidylglycerophosphate synthase
MPEILEAAPLPLELVETVDVSNQARYLRYAANANGFVRAAGGVALGYHLANSEYPQKSWVPAAATAILAATDYVDGVLARRATALDGEKSRLGGWVDQMTDKVFTTSLMGGIACASYKNGRADVGRAVAASTAVTVGRDIWVTAKRVAAERANIGIDTGAQMPGKIKAVGQMVALVAAASPLVERSWANRVVAGAIGVSAGLSVSSGVSYARKFTAAMKARDRVTANTITEG